MPHQRHVSQAPTTFKTLPFHHRPLKFVVMNILGLSEKSKDGNQYIELIKERYTKFTRAIPTTKATAPQVEGILFEHLIMPYGIATHLLTQSGGVGWKFVRPPVRVLQRKQLTTNSYH